MDHFLGIDPAKENIGLVLCKGDATQIELIAAVRVPYVSDTAFIQKIINFITLYDVKPWLMHVAIEKQPYNSVISSNMRYVQGYLTAFGAKVTMKMPITYKLKIQSYKERKEYGIHIALGRLNSSLVKNPNVLYEAIANDARKHDICDGFNLAFDLWSAVKR